MMPHAQHALTNPFARAGTLQSTAASGRAAKIAAVPDLCFGLFFGPTNFGRNPSGKSAGLTFEVRRSRR
jgi:hypothetical protein